MTTARQKIVVIGAGLGGLSAAIRLAVAGLSVTLVEMRAGPGGKMRALASEAGPVDAGPTVLTLRTVFDDLFACAGARLDDHVTLLRQSTLARHWWPDGSRLDLTDDPAANRAAIAEFAGARAEADFDRFDRQAAQMLRAFDRPVLRAPRPKPLAIALSAMAAPGIWGALHPGRSLAAHLARSFEDPRLRQLFGRYATYVGGAPDLSPAVLALIWQAEAQGVWAVHGGMHRLAQALADLAAQRGVQLRYGTTAREIRRRNGRVAEVALSDGRVLPCDAVVFNGDPAALLAGLLGGAAQQALPPAAAHPRSLSAWVWSFAATPAPFDLLHHNVFFGSNPAHEFGPLSRGRMPDEATLYVCAQDRANPGFVPGSPERFEIIMNAPARTTHLPEEATTCRDRTFLQLERFGLTFSPPPPAQALTTPQDFAALFPGSQGALYGRSPQGQMASFQRPGARTRIPGLYLAGGGAHPGAGVPMATLSGQHAAEAITRDLTLASAWPRTAMRGGMSMVSRLTGRAPSR